MLLAGYTGGGWVSCLPMSCFQLLAYFLVCSIVQWQGVIFIALIVGIIWVGNRFFGLFREIDNSDFPGKQ